MKNTKNPIYDILYDYKEKETYWLVYGKSTDVFGPIEKPFRSKLELEEFKVELLQKNK